MLKGDISVKSVRLLSDILEDTEDNSMGGILFSISKKHSIQLNTRLYLLLSYPLASDLNSFTGLENYFEMQRAVCHSTVYFPLERGTRQGDPLSAYLFILCLETLFIQIPENDNIQGIGIGYYQVKLPAYADDADFLMADVNSLQSVFQTCSTFQLYSSLKLNLEKSEACWIGNKMGSYEMPINCKWINIKMQCHANTGFLQ